MVGLLVQCLIFLAALMAIALGVWFAIAESISGDKPSSSHVQQITSFLLVGMAIAWLIPLFQTYGFDSLYFMLAGAIPVASTVWLINGWAAWRTREQAGALLITIDYPLRRKILIVLAVLSIAFFILNIYAQISLFDVVATYSDSPRLELEMCGIILSVFYLFYSLGLFGVRLSTPIAEVRERGFVLPLRRTMIPWHRIESYNWDSPRSHLLTIRLSHSFPGFFSAIKLQMSADQRSAVHQLLRDHVPKYLFSED